MNRPLLLAAGLLAEAMFAMLAAVANHMSGWATIDDDVDDLLLASVKAKRARRKRKLAAEQGPKTRPRKWLLITPLVALALASCIDALILTLTTESYTFITLQIDAVWPTVLALSSYAAYAVKYQLWSPDELGGSMLLKGVCALSVVFYVSIFACMCALSSSRESQIVHGMISARRIDNSTQHAILEPSDSYSL